MIEEHTGVMSFHAIAKHRNVCPYTPLDLGVGFVSSRINENQFDEYL
jgi:hypothetical protein